MGAQETSSWAPMRPDDPTKIERFGELAGLHDLPSGRRLELLPYVATSARQRPLTPSHPDVMRLGSTANAGLDIKHGLGSRLTLDATVNPDFGQVEADPAQVNLTAAELFVADRRPFFTEGADALRFGLAFDPGSPEQLFYSRRVGSAPRLRHLDPVTALDPTTRTTIPVAAKISGRLAHDVKLGMLAALTAREDAMWLDSTGAQHQAIIEPSTMYGVFRAQRDVNGARTQLGAIGTTVARGLDESSAPFLASSAIAGGADASHRWGRESAWYAAAWLLGSRITGSPAAITSAQRSPVRYYQRSDAAHLTVDSGATALTGFASSYQLGKMAGRWRGGVAGTVRSPGFEVNDLGFQQLGGARFRRPPAVRRIAFRRFRDAAQPLAVFRLYHVSASRE
jgi:hypothetical protein